MNDENLNTNESCDNICYDSVYLKIQMILSTIGILAFFGITGYLVVYGLTDMSKDSAFIVGNLTGIAGAIAKDIYGYYFGSSIGSKQKTSIIEQQHKTISDQN